MDECELIALVSAVACGISKCCSENEMTLLSVVLTQLGDTLATVLAQREINENKKNNENEPISPIPPPI